MWESRNNFPILCIRWAANIQYDDERYEGYENGNDFK